MKFTGHLTRVNKTGYISIPPHILKLVGINEKSIVEFVAIENGFFIQKKLLTCIVTGETSESVVEIFPNICLSKEGMLLLLAELENH